MLHTIFSCESSDYQNWQSEALHWSFCKAKQPGKLTRLLSGESHDSLSSKIDTFLAKPASPDPETGDNYVPYNKPSSIQQWLENGLPEEETILIIDPDCVFVRPIFEEVDRGRVLAHKMWYMEPKRHPGLVERHCRSPDLVASAGIPTFIHRDDLKSLAPLWLNKTRELRSTQVSRKEVNWVCEMWGYTLASAELGLEHDVRSLCDVPNDKVLRQAIIHYCYSATARGWKWDKRQYRRGKKITFPEKLVMPPAKALLEILNNVDWSTVDSQS